MRWGRVLNGVMAGAGLLALAGCGRGAEYQYLEVPDGQTFAKVPAGWTIDSAGWTDFVFVDEGAINSAFVPGDNPIAWRAVVNDTTDGKLPDRRRERAVRRRAQPIEPADRSDDRPGRGHRGGLAREGPPEPRGLARPARG
ncbi:MAG: hypothetical protein R2697_19240 [Ilumatobacteraceae bacterium]